MKTLTRLSLPGIFCVALALVGCKIPDSSYCKPAPASTCPTEPSIVPAPPANST